MEKVIKRNKLEKKNQLYLRDNLTASLNISLAYEGYKKTTRKINEK